MSTLGRLLINTPEPEPEGSKGLSDIFAEQPVSLTEFVTGKRFLNNPPLSPIQYDAVRHIEQIYLPETYPLMVEEFGDYWLPKRSINFATLQWGKGCQAAGETVYDARTGAWVPVEEFGGSFVSTLEGVHKASGSWESGQGQIVRVLTQHGMRNRVFLGHRYLTPEGWKQVRDLQVGDEIAVQDWLPEPSEPQRVPDHEVELAGWWLGDGVMPKDPKRGSVVMLFSDQETVSIAAYKNAVVAAGAVPVEEDMSCDDRRMARVRSRVEAKGKNRTVAQKALRGDPVLGRPRNPLNVLVEKWGLAGKVAGTKRVPSWVFTLPRDQVVLFLSRLWGTDGHVYAPVKGACEVAYTTASEGLALDVQRLLLRIGCLAYVREKRVLYQGERRTYFEVRMRDQETVWRFCSTVVLLDKREAQQRALNRTCGFTPRAGVRWSKIVEIRPDGVEPYYDVEVPGPQHYVGGGGFVSHNSGKDHICRVSSLRIAYLLLCLKSPQEYFGMPSQDIIHMLNVASNRSQAYQAFFKPMTKVVQTPGSWFEEHGQVRQDVIVWDKNVEMISGHADAESQEGLNLILGIADEIDAFKTKDELLQYRPNQNREPTKSAEAILKMIRTSASTRFPESYKVVTISYPRYLGSMIQVLTRDGRKSLEADPEGSREYVSGPHATWEVNPRVKGKEQFAKDYEDDPVMARTMYECQPARAVDPYFRNVEAVRGVIRSDNPLEVSYRLEQAAGASVWIPEYEFHPDLLPMQGANYVVHADLAIKGDRAGLAMSHVQSWREVEATALGEDGEVRHYLELRPQVKVDFAFGYSADLRQEPAREIQIRWVRSLVSELRQRGFLIARVSFDQFQSADSMQILEATGIPTKRVSVDRDETAWRTLRDLIYEGRISLPGLPLLEDELLGLKKLLNGKIDLS